MKTKQLRMTIREKRNNFHFVKKGQSVKGLIIPGLAELAYHTVTTMPGLTNLRDLTGKYKTRQVEIKELCSTIIIETQSLT